MPGPARFSLTKPRSSAWAISPSPSQPPCSNSKVLPRPSRPTACAKSSRSLRRCSGTLDHPHPPPPQAATPLQLLQTLGIFCFQPATKAPTQPSLFPQLSPETVKFQDPCRAKEDTTPLRASRLAAVG